MKTEQLTQEKENGGSLMRLRQAAARCGVSVRTLYRDIADGKLKLSHIRGCSCIKERDFEDYMNRSGTKEKL